MLSLVDDFSAYQLFVFLSNPSFSVVARRWMVRQIIVNLVASCDCDCDCVSIFSGLVCNHIIHKLLSLNIKPAFHFFSTWADRYCLCSRSVPAHAVQKHSSLLESFLFYRCILTLCWCFSRCFSSTDCHPCSSYCKDGSQVSERPCIRLDGVCDLVDDGMGRMVDQISGIKIHCTADGREGTALMESRMDCRMDWTGSYRIGIFANCVCSVRYHYRCVSRCFLLAFGIYELSSSQIMICPCSGVVEGMQA